MEDLVRLAFLLLLFEAFENRFSSEVVDRPISLLA